MAAAVDFGFDVPDVVDVVVGVPIVELMMEIWIDLIRAIVTTCWKLIWHECVELKLFR